ncbi:MAG: Uma2 family endonuclease [Bryobacteraceae bacterium]
MDADEFLRRWESLPDLRYAELIEGVVFLASPLSNDHSSAQYGVTGWLFTYTNRTPGTGGGNELTWVMGAKNVPQPDVHACILPECGGQSGLTPEDYGAGAPELIVEITGSSRSRDLGVKKELYRSVGVKEYLTVELHPRKITWRELVRGQYRDLVPGTDGIIRSRVFPGLWLRPVDVWNGKIVDALELGLKSPEHAAFVKLLESRRRARARRK